MPVYYLNFNRPVKGLYNISPMTVGEWIALFKNGKEAFIKLHDFLVGYTPEKANQFCMAGFILKNTLSENGAVTRGICETNEEGYFTAVHETSNIVKTPEGAAVVDNDGQLTSINTESYASMNMWGLTSEFIQILEDRFKVFFVNMGGKDA